MLPTGACLRGRYTIERVIGQGGMGAVYRAHDTVLGGKVVAVKEMRMAGDIERSKAVALFHREASLLARLEHPGLVDVTDFFEEDAAAYLVMSFVDGVTLAQAVTQERPSIATVLAWMDQVCDVLEYLHGQDPPIIFRDLKPSNIMLDTRGRVRLIDFGIARTLEAGERTATALRGYLTPGFAPIEQYGEVGSTDPRSDVYSLGATTYNLLTGFVPPDPVRMLTGDARLEPLTLLRPDAGLSLETALRRMLEFHKANRFPTMAEARVALRRAAPPAAQSSGTWSTPAAPVAPTLPPRSAPAVPSAPTLPPAPPSAVASAPTLPPASSAAGAGRTVMPSRFCSNCGTPREGLANWCTRCGEAFDNGADGGATWRPLPAGEGPLTQPSGTPPQGTGRGADSSLRGGPAPPSFPRRLHFPTVGTLGTVWVRGSDSEEWRELGEARATLEIPASQHVLLRVAPRPERLMALDDLEPDDLCAVDLSGCAIKDDDLRSLAHANGLVELRASLNPIGDAGLAHLRALAQLRVLHLGKTRVTDESARVLQGFRALQSLHLDHTPLRDATVVGLRALHFLEELDLSFTRITDAAMPPLAELERLRHLAVAGTRVGDRGMVPLARLGSLQWLDLSRTRVTDSGLAHLQDLALQGLLLADTQVEDLGLAAMLGQAHLEELDIGGTRLQEPTLRLLRDQQWMRRLALASLPVSGHLDCLPEGAPLEHLDLSHCPLVRADVECLGRISTLRSLDLRATGLEDDDLDALGHLAGLHELHLDDTRVTGRGLACLLGMRALHTLTLGGCPLQGLPLPQPMQSLERLDLRGTAISDRTLADLRILPSLRALVLSDTALTDASLEHLRPLRLLESLELAGTRIRGRGVEHLRALPRLQSLDLSRTPFQDDGMRNLRGLDGLKHLNLSHTAITRHGLAALPVLAQLEDLDLSFNNLGPGDYRVLPELPALRWMNLAEM